MSRSIDTSHYSEADLAFYLKQRAYQKKISFSANYKKTRKEYKLKKKINEHISGSKRASASPE